MPANVVELGVNRKSYVVFELVEVGCGIRRVIYERDRRVERMVALLSKDVVIVGMWWWLLLGLSYGEMVR
mgnify:CR=1 FL=1